MFVAVLWPERDAQGKMGLKFKGIRKADSCAHDSSSFQPCSRLFDGRGRGGCRGCAQRTRALYVTGPPQV